MEPKEEKRIRELLHDHKEAIAAVFPELEHLQQRWKRFQSKLELRVSRHTGFYPENLEVISCLFCDVM